MFQRLTEPLTFRDMSTQLGRDIKRARARSGLSGPELAMRTGVTPAWIRQVETGRIQKPGIDKLRRIAEELGMDLTPMLAMTDQLGATVNGHTKEPDPSGDVVGLVAALTRALEVQATYLTQIADLRAEVAGLGRDAAEERAQQARLLGALSDQLDELRDLVGTRTASGLPESGRN